MYCHIGNRGILGFLIHHDVNNLQLHNMWMRFNSVPGHHISKGLAESLLPFPVRSQSASVCRVAENRSQNCPCRSHAILADTVGITLQGQLNITMAKQSLYRFGVSSNTDQKRCQAVTQIEKAKSARIVIHQSAL